MKNRGACLRTLVSIVAVFAFVTLNPAVTLAADPPPQNSAHMDGQNSDLADQVMTITDPINGWSDHTPIHEDPLYPMDGCGWGLAVVEFRNESAVLATVHHHDEQEGDTYYVRKYDYEGVYKWDFPPQGEGHLNGTAMWSVPAVDAQDNIFFGDNTRIVRIVEDQNGNPVNDEEWPFSGKGRPLSFHLCNTDFRRVVTVTDAGGVLMINEYDNMWGRWLYDASEGSFYGTNTVAISNDGNWAYVTTFRASDKNKNRLYAFQVSLEERLPAEAEMAKLDYTTTRVDALSQSSPMVREIEVEGRKDYLIYYDVMLDDGDYAVCARHYTHTNTLSEVWKTALGGDAVASFAYGPVYYNGAWRDVIWTFASGERTLKGLALEEIAGLPPGTIVARLRVVKEGMLLEGYKILSALTISRNESPGSEKTVALFNMRHKFIPNADPLIGALELEIMHLGVKDKELEWAYVLSGGGLGSAQGQFIVPNSDDKLIFGQIKGDVICVTDR